MKHIISIKAGNIKRWFAAHTVALEIVKLLLAAIIGWIISFVLPTKPVNASNIQQKELTSTLEYSFRLVEKNVNDSKLQILYDGYPVDDPWLTCISISNSGSYAIIQEDFQHDFNIIFQGSEKVLGARITKTSNRHIFEEIQIKSKIDDDRLIIEDFFLNPGESFSISIITNGKPSKINYDSRISGISELNLINRPKEKEKSFTIVRNVIIAFCVLLCVGVIVIIYIYQKRESRSYSNCVTNADTKGNSMFGNSMLKKEPTMDEDVDK